MPGEEHYLVQMRLLPTTMERLVALQRLLGSVNRTDAVRTAINVALLISQAIKAGKRVWVEHPDGRQSELLVPELVEP